MLTHKGTQVLKTKRLILRPFRTGDAQEMYDNWASDERVTHYLTWSPHKSPKMTQKLLKEWSALYSNPKTYNWAMELDGRAIGNISVVHIDERSEYADLGYCMSFGLWGRGLMTEAARAVISYLFTEVGVNRVGIAHAVKNPASGRVAQKCGLSFEGTKRQAFKTASNEFLDISFHGIVRSEWEKLSACEKDGSYIIGQL